MKSNYSQLGIVLLTIIGLCLWSGCINQGPQEPDLIPAILDTPFQLRINQSAVIKSEKLQIRFSSVTEDSRCPKGVECVWAGRATIVVTIFKNEQNLGGFSLSTEGEDVEVTTFAEYSLRLVQLDPYPMANEEIALSDYIAILVVSKL